MRNLSEDFIGTCQWCFGEYKVNARGKVVLHGYQRPGIGYTLGNCPGYDHAPFEYDHTLTGERIVQLRAEIAKKHRKIEHIDSGKIKKLKNPHFIPENDPRRQQARTYMTSDSAIEFYEAGSSRFEYYLKAMKANLESEVRFETDIVNYLTDQVGNWTKRPIVGIDSPATGKMRYVRDAYDPEKVKQAVAHAERKAIRDAKPGKIAINFYRKLDFPSRSAGLDEDQWRAAIAQHYADEAAFKAEVKKWAKETFSGKVWVGDGDSSELRHLGVNEYGDGYAVEVVAVRPEWQHLDKVMDMFPSAHRCDRDGTRDRETKQAIGKGKDVRLWVDGTTLPR